MSKSADDAILDLIDSSARKDMRLAYVSLSSAASFLYTRSQLIPGVNITNFEQARKLDSMAQQLRMILVANGWE